MLTKKNYWNLWPFDAKFSVMAHGLFHECEEKLRAHFFHTGTPSATELFLDDCQSFNSKLF